eukprot:3049409-Ditylum_brightwellii.AAC.1
MSAPGITYPEFQVHFMRASKKGLRLLPPLRGAIVNYIGRGIPCSLWLGGPDSNSCSSSGSGPEGPGCPGDSPSSGLDVPPGEPPAPDGAVAVSYTHLRAHETLRHL